jgi:hypothetical protein
MIFHLSIHIAMHHVLNSLPPNFASFKSGVKTFEFTYNDRNFKQNDKITFCELNSEATNYTGRHTSFIVKEVKTKSISWYPIIKTGYCILIFKYKKHNKL